MNKLTVDNEQCYTRGILLWSRDQIKSVWSHT